jgi:hypothetical protein
MKKLILLLILLPTLCFAGLQEKQCAVIAQKNANASCADASCTGFMFCQNFEGTGYDNSETWKEAGTVDEDYTTIHLRGSQSCSLANSSSIRHDTGGTYTEIYAFARYQFADATPTVETDIYKNTDGAADFGALSLNTAGKLRCRHGTATNTAASALSDATTYYIWIHFKASTGADDGIMTATVSTTRNIAEATAALGCSVENGDDADTNIDTVFFGNTTAGGAGVIIDQVLVKTSAIGTVCE